MSRTRSQAREWILTRLAPRWKAVVADLAEKHADELERRMKELRRLTSALWG